MRTAFKEWAVIVDALGRGQQVVILRKGGIAEGPGGFRVEHGRFLLFPTRFHQQRDRVVPGARARWDALASAFPPPDRVRLEFVAEVTGWTLLRNPAQLDRIAPFHQWLPEVIRDRFDWGADSGVTLLEVRVSRLPEVLEIPVGAEQAGCRSWIELPSEIPADAATPVLDDTEYGAAVARLHAALGPT